MEYNNSAIRRQDRVLAEERAYDLLRDGEHGVLSMVSTEGEAYGVPVSYAWDGKDAIYIHCAPEGRKLRCIANNEATSLCVVGHTHVLASKFTTNYESIIVKCKAETGLSAEERMDALRLIIEKYAAQFREIGEKYAEKSFHRAEIIKLTMLSMSGKAKDVGE